ncbi:hypothetical protein EIB71_01230 [Kaistella daneshvariae]|uniref:Ada DNA repair metal-binding domain-containing protein n=1 Tax=Kaistella daneshvariae TaxID=2487074 RepID=A0ABM7C5Z6_9FLAO|nr:hypothetical protein [Kaistella daneshvariae]AZI66382.1 hypothetical protein EIB71_01230 [Kaistella daneshvariae]
MMRFFLFIFLSVQLSAQTVYKTPSGAKYHLASCRMVKNVSSSLPLEKALKSGFQPCKICDPPFRAVSGIISKPKKTAGTNSASQCLARTKTGARCKRKTRIGNDFCFQHLP